MSQSYNTSSKYKVISDDKVLNRFFERGFELKKTVMSRTLIPEKQGFQKRVYMLRNPELNFKGDITSAPQVVLVNSHDATTSWRVYIGAHVFACSNGMLAGDLSEIDRIRHVGRDVYVKVDQAIDETLVRFPMVAASIERFKSIQLDAIQADTLARQAVALVLPKNTLTVDFTMALTARHSSQRENNLWNILNRLQESCVKGGIKYQSVTQKRDDHGNVISETLKNNRTREIKDLNRSIKVNRALWQLAEKIAA